MKRELLLLILLLESVANAGDMTFKVMGFKKFEGNVRVALYNSKDTHLSEKTNFFTAVAPVTGEIVYLSAENIPFGVYTAAAVHDADLNGTITKNFLGIPKELFGFSNGAQPSILGAPSFEDSKITFNDNSQVFDITLRSAF